MDADLLTRCHAYLALAEKATPPPWFVHNEPVADIRAAIAELREQLQQAETFSCNLPLIGGGPEGDRTVATTGTGPTGTPNAAFIAQSHEAAALIRELLNGR